jgi:hypothetical protein
MRETGKFLSSRLAGWSLAAFTALSIPLHPIVTAAQYNIPNADLVTHDDCEIIAKVMTTQRVNALGMASFGSACDWAKLEWSVPTTTATTDWRVFFRRPRYSADRKHAKVSYSNSYNGADGMYGSHRFDCSFEKKRGRWEVVECTLGVIVN